MKITKNLVMIVGVLVKILTKHLPSTGLESYRYANLSISIMAIDQYISQKSSAKNTPWPLSASFILKPNVLINAELQYKALLCCQPIVSWSIRKRRATEINYLKTSSILLTILNCGSQMFPFIRRNSIILICSACKNIPILT
jgi:hypothetical protein